VIGALVLCLAAASPPGGPPRPVRIGRIEIRAVDVFSPAEAARGSFYRLANSVHITTRDGFLRKQLLFHEGDPFDPEALAETERNLRALPFIRTARVQASAPHDGVVDVLVETQDAWSTQPGGSLGSKGGVTTYSADLEETNLLGTGRSVSVSYEKDIDRIKRSFLFQDPYLFRPFWRGTILVSQNSDGRRRFLELARPFYSFHAPWSADAFVNRDSEDEKIYDGGVTASTFRRNHREWLLFYGRALVRSDRGATRLSAGFDSVDDEFQPSAVDPSPIVPEARQFRYVFVEFESVGNSFLTLNYVNQGSRYEDFNLAPRLFVKAGYSPRALGAGESSGLLEAEASGGRAFGAESFAQGDLFFQTRLAGGIQNAILSGFAGFVRRFSRGRIPQTLVARIQFDRGWRLDRDVQFAADGATGLRGYRLHAMTGDRRVILNVEDRFFSRKEFLQLVSPGAVVFVDTGTAAPEGRALRLSDFRTDVGAGLRLGIARAGNNNILRIDVAYAFNADPQGRRGLLVSFSSSQAFSFRRTSPSGRQ
jgi:hypothetical protein